MVTKEVIETKSCPFRFYDDYGEVCVICDDICFDDKPFPKKCPLLENDILVKILK